MNEEVGTLIREIPILYGETLDFRGILFLIPSEVNYFNSWLERGRFLKNNKFRNLRWEGEIIPQDAR